MKHIFFIFLLNIFLIAKSQLIEENSSTSLHSRKRRYLIFPEGASFAVSVCTQAQLIGPAIFTEAVAFGIAFDLPNNISDLKPYHYPKSLLKKKYRRDLYKNIEALIDSAGYDGRSCIYRALCEASQRYFNNPQNIIEKVLSIVFSFPQKQVSHIVESNDHHLYHEAYALGKVKQENYCEDVYPECNFSLLDLALGDYSMFNNI